MEPIVFFSVCAVPNNLICKQEKVIFVEFRFIVSCNIFYMDMSITKVTGNIIIME